jgi:hypothetical protein
VGARDRLLAGLLTMSAAQAPGRIGTGGGLESPGDVGGSERLYAGLLWLYPGEFRRRYADEMVRLFADQLRDARATGRPGVTAATWLRSLIDLVANAIGEHLRKDRAMAQSLATFEPTRTMRLLGLFGILGAGLLLWAFVSFNPFADPTVNGIRLFAFSLAGAAISLAFYRRQSLVAPTLALLTTGAVVIAGAWYATWLILSSGVKSPHIGTFGLISLLAGIALWVTPAIWAIGLLHTGAAWQGMSSNRALLAKLGAAILIGSIVAWFGDDRIGMVDSLWGEMWQAVALAGVAMNGMGWLILGVVLVAPGRGPRAEI